LMEVVESLLVANADVNAMRCSKDWRGCGSDASAFEMILPPAMKDAALLRKFLAAGANANTRAVRHVHSMRTDGQSVSFVLHQAARCGNIEVVRAFLQAGAQVDAVASEHFVNERGHNRHMEETSLHVACKRGDFATAALLIEHGADLNAVREDLEQEEVELSNPNATDDPRDDDFEPRVRCIPIKETALHLAITVKNQALVALLTCAGAEAGDRQRGDVCSSCEELCRGDAELLRALKAEWPDARCFFHGDLLASAEQALADK